MRKRQNEGNMQGSRGQQCPTYPPVPDRKGRLKKGKRESKLKRTIHYMMDGQINMMGMGIVGGAVSNAAPTFQEGPARKGKKRINNRGKKSRIRSVAFN